MRLADRGPLVDGSGVRALGPKAYTRRAPGTLTHGVGQGTLPGPIGRVPRSAWRGRRSTGPAPFRSPPPMRPHDAAYKLLFSFPEMVRDLLA